MRFLSSVAAAVLLLVAPGCATLSSGTTDTITFTSEPAGAEVLIGGLSRGRTPTTIPVKRPGFGSRTVTMRLDGHDPVTFEMASSFNGVSILNIFVPIGFVVDAVTGSITKYSQTNYTVDMTRGSVALDLSDLDRTAEGAVVVPESAGNVVVTDAAAGLQYVFTK